MGTAFKLEVCFHDQGSQCNSYKCKLFLDVIQFLWLISACMCTVCPNFYNTTWATWGMIVSVGIVRKENLTWYSCLVKISFSFLVLSCNSPIHRPGFPPTLEVQMGGLGKHSTIEHRCDWPVRLSMSYKNADANPRMLISMAERGPVFSCCSFAFGQVLQSSQEVINVKMGM